MFKILGKAKENNSNEDITGNLLYDGGRFIQLLEGDKEIITSLYVKIARDTRHKNLRLLYLEEASMRLFPNWGMNMVNLKVD